FHRRPGQQRPLSAGSLRRAIVEPVPMSEPLLVSSADAAIPEVSIVMPCLNEAETLAVCIAKARRFFESSGVHGEVVVADNGSNDGSQQIAASSGARVVPVAEKG